jgi:hypothetical protein
MRGVKLASDTADTVAAVLRRAKPNVVVRREGRIVTSPTDVANECNCGLRANVSANE